MEATVEQRLLGGHVVNTLDQDQETYMVLDEDLKLALAVSSTIYRNCLKRYVPSIKVIVDGKKKLRCLTMQKLEFFVIDLLKHRLISSQSQAWVFAEDLFLYRSYRLPVRTTYSPRTKI